MSAESFKWVRDYTVRDLSYMLVQSGYNPVVANITKHPNGVWSVVTFKTALSDLKFVGAYASQGSAQNAVSEHLNLPTLWSEDEAKFADDASEGFPEGTPDFYVPVSRETLEDKRDVVGPAVSACAREVYVENTAISACDIALDPDWDERLECSLKVLKQMRAEFMKEDQYE